MDHTVTGHYISSNDLRIVHGNVTSRKLYLEGRTVGGLNPATLYVFGQHPSRNHMVGEDGDQLLFVFGFQEALQRALGQFCKSCIGRSKHRVRPFAFKSIDQPSSFDGRYQSLKRFIAGSNVYDVTGSLAAVAATLIALVATPQLFPYRY